MNKKIQIIILTIIIFGLCTTRADAFLLQTINYKLDPTGGLNANIDTPDFYIQQFDVIYIVAHSDGVVDIRLQDNAGTVFATWNNNVGNISLEYLVETTGAFLLNITNLESRYTIIVGGVYLNAVDTTTIVTTSHNTHTTDNWPEINPIFLLLGIYGIAAVLFVIAVVIWRRRRRPDFKFLKNIDDEELLPKGWEPEDEEF